MNYNRSEYSKQQFWDDQFLNYKTNFDWYIGFEEFKIYLDQLIKIDKDAKILNIGVGNSLIPEKMYDYGYKNVLNIDISQIVIDKMRQVNIKKNKNIDYLQMDATNMPLQAKVFDYVFDKGTLDALICGSNLEFKLISEIKRVLKDNGKFILISHGSPQKRQKFFNEFQNSQIRYSKQDLNDQSQLINILRCYSDGRPLKALINDPELVQKAFIEIKNVKKSQILKRALKPKMKLLDKHQIEILEDHDDLKDDDVYAPQRQRFCYIYEIQNN